MKKKLFLLLPLLFICISGILIYQTRNTRNEYRNTVESSAVPELTPFEKLQNATNTDLVDLGEAMISFVHFEDKEATLTTDNTVIKLPLTVVDSETNQFSLETLKSSPKTFIIGDVFGLAIDENDAYYYYSLE